MRRILVSIMLMALAQSDQPNEAIYLDHQRPLEERVQELISRLSLEEKAVLLYHRGPETLSLR